MNPTIYVITYYEFNHGSMRPGRPLDRRFLETDKNYIFYLIDKNVPSVLQNQKTILEYNLDPTLHKAGGAYLGEWSFLLAEAKHSFCQYPFFMISSRFYEKNEWLKEDLNTEWDKLFSFFKEYEWGYLPSYDRPLHWVNLSWEKLLKKKAWEFTLFPFSEKTYQLVKDLFHVNIPKDYGYTADLFCNYIGFKSRNELLTYVNFYRPLLDYFFYLDFSPKRDISPYVRPMGFYRNEKPFTFFLELLCHLFFFKNKKKYFSLHYDGYYEINEFQTEINCIKSFSIPLKTALYRSFQWQWSKLYGILSRTKNKLKKHKILYKIAKILLKK